MMVVGLKDSKPMHSGTSEFILGAQSGPWRAARSIAELLCVQPRGERVVPAPPGWGGCPCGQALLPRLDLLPGIGPAFAAGLNLALTDEGVHARGHRATRNAELAANLGLLGAGVPEPDFCSPYLRGPLTATNS